MEECEFEAYTREYFGLTEINENEPVKVHQGTLVDFLCGFKQKFMADIPTEKEITKLSFKQYPGSYPTDIINRQKFQFGFKAAITYLTGKKY